MKLPTYAEILEILKKETGMSIDEIEKKVQQIREEYGEFCKSNSLAAFMLAYRLGINLSGIPGVADTYIKTRDVAALESDYYDIKGYLFRAGPYRFHIVDKWGCLPVRTWANTEEFDGKFVEVKNLYLRRVRDNVYANLYESGEIAEIEPEYDLNECIKSTDEPLSNGDVVLVSGLVLKERIREYDGCPLHSTKLDENNYCRSCGQVIEPERLKWVRGTISDGSSIFRFEISPDFRIDSILNKLVQMICVWREDDKVLRAIGVKVVDILGKADSSSLCKGAKKPETNSEPSKEADTYNDTFGPSKSAQNGSEAHEKPKEEAKKPKKVKFSQIKKYLSELMELYEVLPSNAVIKFLKERLDIQPTKTELVEMIIPKIDTIEYDEERDIVKYVSQEEG
ncbi:MAG: hypothetical protein ACTSUO_00730 [Candidatus Thorarchaeota archaeon]